MRGCALVGGVPLFWNGDGALVGIVPGAIHSKGSRSSVVTAGRSDNPSVVGSLHLAGQVVDGAGLARDFPGNRRGAGSRDGEGPSGYAY